MLHDCEWRLSQIQLAELKATANVFEVLVTSLIFLNVGSKVRVDDTDVGVMKAKADGHSTFVSLQRNKTNSGKTQKWCKITGKTKNMT